MHLACSICCELFASSDETGVTECGHLFHFDCALPWISDNRNCPQCRQNCSADLRRVYLTGTSDENVHLNSNCNINNSSSNGTVVSLNPTISNNELRDFVSSFEELQCSECLDRSDVINCLKSDLQISTEKISELKLEITSLEESLKIASEDRHELLDQIELSEDNIEHLLFNNRALKATVRYLRQMLEN